VIQVNRRILMLALAGAALAAGFWTARPGAAAKKHKQVLVVTYAQGFKHSSRPVAAATVKSLGQKTGAWDVVAVADTQEELNRYVNPAGLKNLNMVFFANTTGDLGLTPANKAAFYDWIRAGGAYAGVHSASDTYHGDADYLNLVRGEFLTHGPQVKVTVYNQDPRHPATRGVPLSFQIYDEIYQFKNWDRSRVHVLLTMTQHPDPARMKERGDFPVAWTNRLGKGRMFYTSLGHREDVYENPIYLNHLTGGIMWALGLARGSDTPGNPLVAESGGEGAPAAAAAIAPPAIHSRYPAEVYYDRYRLTPREYHRLRMMGFTQDEAFLIGNASRATGLPTRVFEDAIYRGLYAREMSTEFGIQPDALTTVQPEWRTREWAAATRESVYDREKLDVWY